MSIRRGHLRSVDGPCATTAEVQLARRQPESQHHGVPRYVGKIWCRNVLAKAYVLARDDSDDPRTQNAALVYDWDGNLIGAAANTLPLGLALTDEILADKQSYIEHAERNALYCSIRHGESAPAVIVCPWAPCAACARAIVQSGIRCLVRHRGKEGREEWRASLEAGEAILEAGGVRTITISEPITEAPAIMVAGSLYDPAVGH